MPNNRNEHWLHKNNAIICEKLKSRAFYIVLTGLQLIKYATFRSKFVYILQHMYYANSQIWYHLCRVHLKLTFKFNTIYLVLI